MKQQSPFVRYHRNWLGISTNTAQIGELAIQTKTSEFEGTVNLAAGANIYLQSLEENDPPPTGSGKKEKKIKVFGIPQNRIKREESIPQPFATPPEEKSQTGDQILIDSNLQIGTASLIEEKHSELVENPIEEENQLQKLLYFSGSSASIPPPELAGNQNRAQSVATQEIDQILQNQFPKKEKQVKESSIHPSKINVQIKNTQSSFLAEDAMLKGSLNQKLADKSSLNVKAKDNKSSVDEKSKILELSNAAILEKQLMLEMNTISPIPNKYDEMVQTSMFLDQPKLKIPYKSPKHELKPAIPLPKKTEKSPANIKNYLESYGSYEQEIQKMINKLEKVSDLKGKEQSIKRQLQTLTHKKRQSVGSIESQPKSSPKSYEPHSPSPKKGNLHVFAQSASNFIPREPMGGSAIERELNKDVAKMERIINKFKEISQIISTDGAHIEEKEPIYRQERSEKNFRGTNSSNPLMFQSEKLNVESIELPNYSYKKTISQPHIQLKVIDKMKVPLNDSQEIESQNYTCKGKEFAEATSRNGDRPSIMPYYTNTIRTEKKPLHGLIEKCQSRYDLDLHQNQQCECIHVNLAQQVARLSQKIQDLEKEKQVRQARSLDTPSSNKPLKKEDKEESVQEESSFFQLLPKQKEESIESIKTKIGKQNPHLCSNLQPVSILKQASAVKKTPSSLKAEELKGSPAQQRQRTSKDLPPRPKNVGKSPQIKKDVIKQNQFKQEINMNDLKLDFPNLCNYLSINSSESSIIRFGEGTYTKLFAYATERQGLRGARLEQKAGFKIKKYEDCIHYYLHNSLNYHLICYFRGKLYFGQIKDSSSDCKHGFGYYSTPKYTYEGEFALDKKNGKGTINYSNGDIYKGSWRNGKKEGEGILINLAGDIFKGTFLNGKKNGRGQERLKNGDFYRGEFKEGKLDGEGTYWWCDGSVYQGSFKGGLLHGRGIWRSKENDSYEGEYRQNKKHGKGIYKWSNGMIFTGIFEADQQIQSKKPFSPTTQRKNSKSSQRNGRTRQNSAKKIPPSIKINH